MFTGKSWTFWKNIQNTKWNEKRSSCKGNRNMMMWREAVVVGWIPRDLQQKQPEGKTAEQTGRKFLMFHQKLKFVFRFCSWNWKQKSEGESQNRFWFFWVYLVSHQKVSPHLDIKHRATCLNHMTRRIYLNTTKFIRS